MHKLILPLLVLVSFGFVKTESAPLFESERKFYRAGDTVKMSIETDTTIDVAFCTDQGKATVFYRIERLENDAWSTVFNNALICQTSMPNTMQVGKGFTIKHFLLAQGRFRIVVSNRYPSAEFEVR